ncbi:unnamed protein product [Closterium sp. Yama58-4]|nr:unnamed protein product [Closterium sp. Yama58-4]
MDRVRVYSAHAFSAVWCGVCPDLAGVAEGRSHSREELRSGSVEVSESGSVEWKGNSDEIFISQIPPLLAFVLNIPSSICSPGFHRCYRRERDGAVAESKAQASQREAERAEMGAQMERLQSQVADAEQRLRDTQNQLRLVQEELWQKEDAVKEAQGWAAHGQDMEAHVAAITAANQSLHGELRERTDQCHHLFAVTHQLRQQLAESERYHMQLMQRLHMENTDLRSRLGALPAAAPGTTGSAVPGSAAGAGAGAGAAGVGPAGGAVSAGGNAIAGGQVAAAAGGTLGTSGGGIGGGVGSGREAGGVVQGAGVAMGGAGGVGSKDGKSEAAAAQPGQAHPPMAPHAYLIRPHLPHPFYAAPMQTLAASPITQRSPPRGVDVGLGGVAYVPERPSGEASGAAESDAGAEGKGVMEENVGMDSLPASAMLGAGSTGEERTEGAAAATAPAPLPAAAAAAAAEEEAAPTPLTAPTPPRPKPMMPPLPPGAQLKDDRALLTCIVRTLSADRGAKALISTTVAPRLARLLAPLTWAHYEPLYGSLHQLIASKPELFGMEGPDHVFLRSNAHAIIATLPLHPTMPLPHPSSSIPSPATSLPLALTPAAPRPLAPRSPPPDASIPAGALTNPGVSSNPVSSAAATAATAAAGGGGGGGGSEEGVLRREVVGPGVEGAGRGSRLWFANAAR